MTTQSKKIQSAKAIQVMIRNVYGNELIYPICPAADCFAALTKTKTLSFADLTQIHLLGYAVDIIDGKETKAGKHIAQNICS